MIEESEGFSAVGEPAIPASNHIQNAWVLSSECCLVSRDDKESAFRNTDIWEDEVNALKGPSSQVD